MGIPYASAVGPDKKESVVDLAVQTLIVFLDYVIPGRGSPAPASARGVSTEQVLDSVRYGMPKVVDQPQRGSEGSCIARRARARMYSRTYSPQTCKDREPCDSYSAKKIGRACC